MRAGLLLHAVAALLLCLSFFSIPSLAAAEDFDLSKLKQGGYVVLLRHVKAGGSDADDFDLGDCRTQRQVGSPGRKQAAILRERFQAAGITEVTVVSSQYCRAKQTAALLGLGSASEAAGLNYFHWRLGSEAAMVRGFRDYLSKLRPPAAGQPLILVTHKHAFVEVGVPEVKSGGGVIIKPNGTAKPEVVGRITAP